MVIKDRQFIDLLGGVQVVWLEARDMNFGGGVGEWVTDSVCITINFGDRARALPARVQFRWRPHRAGEGWGKEGR